MVVSCKAVCPSVLAATLPLLYCCLEVGLSVVVVVGVEVGVVVVVRVGVVFGLGLVCLPKYVGMGRLIKDGLKAGRRRLLSGASLICVSFAFGVLMLFS